MLNYKPIKNKINQLLGGKQRKESTDLPQRHVGSDIIGLTPRRPPGVTLQSSVWRVSQEGYLRECLCSEYTFTLQVGVCIVTAEALGVLPYVAALWAWFWGRDEPGEHALVASNGSLESQRKQIARKFVFFL